MHNIVLVHGIRTHAFWYDVVKPTLEDLPDTRVITVGYGWFDVIRFLLPGPTRRGPQAIVARELRVLQTQAAATRRADRISVIAHSFGTYTIAKVLRDNPDIRLHNLVLCGTVLPTTYDWAHVRPQIAHKIVNEVGYRDPWPLLAKVLSFGYGSSGTNGFGRAHCEDRHHDVDHGSFFRFGLIHTYWHSLFGSGAVVPSSFNRNAGLRPWFIRLLSKAPTSVVPLASLAGGALYLIWRWGLPVFGLR